MRHFSKAIVLLSGICLLTTACSKSKSRKGSGARPVTSVTTTGDINAAPTAPPSDEGNGEFQGPLRPDEEQVRVNRVVRNGDIQTTTTRPLERPIEEDQPARISESANDPAQQQIQNNSGPVVENQPAVKEEITGGSRNEQCGTAYRADKNSKFFPGLPYPPSQARICTGGKVGKVSNEDLFKCEAGTGFLFTDGRQDGLMALVVERINKLPGYMEQGSRELARRIRDVQVDGNLLKVGSVNVRIALFAGRGRYEHVDLRGHIKKSRSEIKLHSVGAKGRLNFSGTLTCADSGDTCDNAIIRLDQKTTKGRVGRVAYLIYRSGDAHVTMSDQERMGSRSIPNQAHSRFAKYLSNTVLNTCLDTLKDLHQGQRQIPNCAYQRLKLSCGGQKYRQPSAKFFDLNTWAVAYGRAGFEFAMSDGAQTERLTIKGPLVASNQIPMWPRALKVGGSMANNVKGAILMANDGGGNLNLAISFNGEESESRISITTLTEDTRLGAQQVSERAQQMPSVDKKDLADQRDIQDVDTSKVSEQAPQQQQAALQNQAPDASTVPQVDAQQPAQQGPVPNGDAEIPAQDDQDRYSETN